MKRIAALTILVWIFSLPAAAADSNIEIMSFEDPGSGVASYQVKQSQFDTLPRWNDKKGDPPLSQRKAVDSAVAELKRRNLSIDALVLQSVSLKRIKEAPDGHWFYGITFAPATGGISKPFWKTMVLVLMDGTVVNPVVSVQ